MKREEINDFMSSIGVKGLVITMKKYGFSGSCRSFWPALNFLPCCTGGWRVLGESLKGTKVNQYGCPLDDLGSFCSFLLTEFGE